MFHIEGKTDRSHNASQRIYGRKKQTRKLYLKLNVPLESSISNSRVPSSQASKG